MENDENKGAYPSLPPEIQIKALYEEINDLQAKVVWLRANLMQCQVENAKLLSILQSTIPETIDQDQLPFEMK